MKLINQTDDPVFFSCSVTGITAKVSPKESIDIKDSVVPTAKKAGLTEAKKAPIKKTPTKES
jgi:hypothetical protein